MLWLITGGIASGKSLFAEHLAASIGREGIHMSCPAFPGRSADARMKPDRVSTSQGKSFEWLRTEADESLALKLRAVNRESNLYRADRRVLVVDSLSGWLRRAVTSAQLDSRSAENSTSLDLAFAEAMDELLSYQGKLIVVTEEPAALLSMDAWTAWYTYRLAEANRALSERSRTVYRLTAGIASEVKGYRVIREVNGDENIYKDGR
ncbi:bifunctional adenosylcobinamide kinase/adenosylcobinamide-phosphate guanylyltransferase [Cohnella yongneupensis]|uniref:Bifunctional adenosylcobinamide kinase/adenosylcobinamide-phosphate guanylyltransferase n=1 Tax=Cohnella yongneupensis TaxID=425006 RepID=A0ABW0QUW2_9BACL